MQIDPRTIFWVFMLTQGVATAVFWLTARRHPHLKGPDWWGIGCFAAMIGFIGILLRGTIPDFISLNLANGLLVAATMFLWAGLRAFFGRSTHSGALVFIILLATLLHTLFTFIWPSLTVRTIIVSFFNGMGALFALRELIQQRKSSLSIECNLLSAILVIDALLHLLRIIGTLATTAPDGSAAPSPLDGAFLLTFVISAIARLTLFISLISGRLQDERKEADDQLRASEMRFRNLLEAIPSVSVQGFGADGITNFWNKASQNIYGYSAEEAIGNNLFELIVPSELRVSMTAAVQHMFQTGLVTPTSELTLKRKDGSPVSVISSHAYVNLPGMPPELFRVDTDISQRKAAEEQINKLAYYDSLTELPNRWLLMDRLQQAQAARGRSPSEGALLFIDLDNFKTLNDTLGHDIGDQLLKQVAHRLVKSVRVSDTVARLGGDDFVVMLEDLSDTQTQAAAFSEIVARKVLVALTQPYQLGSHEHHGTASVGITLFGDPHEGLPELLKRGDLAMYQAKAAGRNTVRLFDPEMQAAVSKRVTMEAELREGIGRNELQLYYQAQVNEVGRVIGAEALVRWLHPSRGMVSPAEFIPLAEETGLIVPLGNWVAETGLRQLAIWSTEPEMAHLSLAINISARQFKHKNFVDLLMTMVEKTGANPLQMKLELTESILVDDIDDIILTMTRLKSYGFSFSLDDFGTGYSSLSYLKRLPLDQLKIDQSFVRDILTDPNDAAISRTIVALAQSLGLAVIAEGVETQAQRDFLAAAGCPSYQGYFFSRPLPVKDFETFARESITAR
jgi:diguanylate cyclase (GGDEF)-like protein/PAS domain S-box-containing protein